MISLKRGGKKEVQGSVEKKRKKVLVKKEKGSNLTLEGIGAKDPAGRGSAGKEKR